MAFLPRQDIPNKDKNHEWVKKHFTYADGIVSASNPRVAKYTRLYNEYNGRINPYSVEYLTKAYGKKNRTKYIAYRWSRPKLDLINNEFLLRPLQATVYTTNQSAKTAKLDNYEMLVGAITAKKEINKLRENGIDPMEGMDIPDKIDEDTLAEMSFKDMNEDLMQLIINEQTLALEMKLKLAQQMLDVEIVGECYGRIYVDENGDEDFVRIDPRNRICEEIEGDTFFMKSPVQGHKEQMPIHDALMYFNLNQEQRDKLDEIRKNWDPQNTNAGRSNYLKINGAVCADVIFLEWYGCEAEYTKVSPKTNKQMAFDSSTDSYRLEMSANWYEGNKDEHDKQVEKYHAGKKAGKIPNGSYDVEVVYREVAYREVRIGDDIFVYTGKAKDGDDISQLLKMPFTMRREDDKENVLSLSYVGARYNVVNGETISLQEECENFDNALDINMYQILKELNRSKGKILAYNRDTLPKGKTVKDIMYEALNDQFLSYSASGQSNTIGKDITLTDMFKEIDLSVSSTFPYLIELKQELQATLDKLTGINENREGDIAASSTATNAQSSIRASKTITEGMFYLMGLYTEKVFVRLCETTKLTWGLYKTEKAKVILGDKLFKFMQVTQSIAYQDYGIHLLDGGKELSLREKWERNSEAALNAKDLRFKDIVNFDLAPTLVEAKAVLLNAYDQMEKLRAQEAQANNEAAAKQNQDSLATQIQISQEDREDKQKFKLEEIEKQADADIRVGKALGTHDAKNNFLLQSHKSEHDLLNIDEPKV